MQQNTEETSKVLAKVVTTSKLAKEAFKELKKFQDGTRKLLKTGRDYIDCHIGGLKPSDLVLIAAGSGVGKTYEFIRVLNGIMNEEINPLAKNFVSLEFMLEMKFLDLIVRETSAITKKKKRQILTESFDEYEKQLIQDYYNTLKDGRRFVVEESVNTEEFEIICEDFCEKNKDKDAIIISIDHLALMLAKGKENPLKETVIITNKLRKKYHNVFFIYLSQLNRDREIAERNNIMVPRTSNIFGSSEFEFLSSYVVVMANPFKDGVEEYMKVREDRYPELKQFMVEGTRGNYHFNTLGNIFYHVLKIRESDVPYNNLHIESMNLSEEQLKRMKLDVEVKDNSVASILNTVPSFNTPKKSYEEELDDLYNDKFDDVPF